MSAGLGPMMKGSAFVAAGGVVAARACVASMTHSIFAGDLSGHAQADFLAEAVADPVLPAAQIPTVHG